MSSDFYDHRLHDIFLLSETMVSPDPREDKPSQEGDTGIEDKQGDCT